MKPLHLYSAKQLRDLFIQGEIKAVEIADYFFARCDRHNHSLGAYLCLLKERALLKAERLDRKRAQGTPLGKLAAVPVAIKDNTHIAGEITTCASRFLKHYKAPFDATAVRYLEEEDALLIGKTNLDEFAMGSSNENSAFFPANNPWNTRCVAGGSSGGSAAAVAARLALLSTGSDTGGSIRLPAGFCGVVGFKPTYGRISRYGLVAFGSSLDQIGPMAGSVEDAALMMEAMGKYCPCDATSLSIPPDTYGKRSGDLKGVRFGIPRRLLESLNPEVRENFDASVATCKALGATIVDVDLELLKYSIAVYYILATAEASTNLARFDGIRFGARSEKATTLDEVYELSRAEGFGPEVKRRILLGTYVLSAGFQDAYYKKAQKVRTLIIQAFEQAFRSCDAILTPVATSPAFERGALGDPLQMYLQDLFTIPANLAGLPAVSVPSGFSANQMPLALQITGPQLCDVAVLDYAYAFEKALALPTIAPAYAGGQ